MKEGILTGTLVRSVDEGSKEFTQYPNKLQRDPRNNFWKKC